MVQERMFQNISWRTEFRTYINCEPHTLHTKNTWTTWYTCYDVNTVRVTLVIFTEAPVLFVRKLIQGIHKRMVRFQKLTRNLFLTLNGHNVHRQQRQLSKFRMRNQQFASHAYCGAAGPVSKMASQQGNAFCVLRFEVSIFSKPCTKLALHCNHRSGHLNTEHTERVSLLRRHLGNWPRSKHEKRTAGSA